MRTWAVTAATVTMMVGPAAGLAAADPQDPLDVIEQLELAGYTVNIDRIGNAPIQDCIVTDVRNPQQITVPAVIVDEEGHAARAGFDDVVDVIVRQSISVSLDCTR